jgi:hypothetical protein
MWSGNFTRAVQPRAGLRTIAHQSPKHPPPRGLPALADEMKKGRASDRPPPIACTLEGQTVAHGRGERRAGTDCVGLSTLSHELGSAGKTLKLPKWMAKRLIARCEADRENSLAWQSRACDDFRTVFG